MKVKEARALIGKRVEWEYAHDRHRGTCLVRSGVVEDVQGRNVFIRDVGVYWLPQMENLKEVKP